MKTKLYYFVGLLNAYLKKCFVFYKLEEINALLGGAGLVTRT